VSRHNRPIVARNYARLTNEVSMTVAIAGGYTPYFYLVLLHVALAFLQQPGAVRSEGPAREASAKLADQYHTFARAIGSLLSWLSWMLSIYVGYRFSVASAVMFFVVGFATSVGSIMTVTYMPQLSRAGLLASFLASVYLTLCLMLSVGYRAGFGPE
jgi:hypothetical protein